MGRYVNKKCVCKECGVSYETQDLWLSYGRPPWVGDLCSARCYTVNKAFGAAATVKRRVERGETLGKLVGPRKANRWNTVGEVRKKLAFKIEAFFQTKFPEEEIYCDPSNLISNRPDEIGGACSWGGWVQIGSARQNICSWDSMKSLAHKRALLSSSEEYGCQVLSLHYVED